MLSADAIGAYLQENRISRSIELEEVSAATGISIGVLKTLENDAKEQFPAKVYVKAFYKKYAQYLGLDPEEILSAYQQQAHKQNKKKSRSNRGTIVTLKGQEESLFAETARSLFVPIIVVLGCILLYWLYKNYLASHNPFDFF